MRTFSMILFAVGFLAAALATVSHADAEGLDWQTVNWTHYIASFLVGVAGVVGLRATASGTAKEEHKIDAEMQDLETGLANLVRKLEALIAESESLSVYDVHLRIDDQLVEDLETFVAAREAMITRFGLQPYADIMSLFAGGERLINRTWSASADGYVDEVWKCVDDALRQMQAAQAMLAEQQAKNVGGGL